MNCISAQATSRVLSIQDNLLKQNWQLLCRSLLYAALQHCQKKRIQLMSSQYLKAFLKNFLVFIQIFDLRKIKVIYRNYMSIQDKKKKCIGKGITLTRIKEILCINTTTIFHLSNTGGSLCISSVSEGMRVSGTHSSHSSSISYKHKAQFSLEFGQESTIYIRLGDTRTNRIQSIKVGLEAYIPNNN